MRTAIKKTLLPSENNKMPGFKSELLGFIDEYSKRLIEMSNFLYHNPENAGEEYQALNF